MKRKNRYSIEAILVQFVGDTLRTLAYALLIIYIMQGIFAIELNPAFPLKGDGILVGSISCFILLLACRLLESRLSGEE